MLIFSHHHASAHRGCLTNARTGYTLNAIGLASDALSSPLPIAADKLNHPCFGIVPSSFPSATYEVWVEIPRHCLQRLAELRRLANGVDKELTARKGSL